MLTRNHVGALVLLISAVLVVSGSPAVADDWYGDVACGQNPHPGCELGAGQRGTATHPPTAPGKPSPSRGKPGAPADPWGDRLLGQGGPRADCSYVRSDYQPPANGVRTISHRSRPAAGMQFASARRRLDRSPILGQAPGQGGAWYVYRCTGEGERDALYRAPVWIPDGDVPGAGTTPSPEQLAEQARAQLRLPQPMIVTSPPDTQLVGVPTWLWLDRAMWRPRSATASVPAVAVTATATPTTVSWSTGDGATVTCAGPGTPFSAGVDPRSPSPDCGHTYRRSSAAMPAEQFPTTITVSWRITWAGAGAAGAFPDMTTSVTAPERVAEAQALGTK
ncbi:hypothetical protein [Amycolatopsis sp. cmx-4-68]|uniref:hypothetical protein n=1 Tax=Amycolatopsis sp. cmx-4-68 TaxID=2790938 RepID=UPI003979EB44